MIEPGTIRVKNVNVLRNILEPRIHPTLAQILEDITLTFGVMITEGYRIKRHINDLHGTTPVRAIDIRSWHYKNPQLVAEWINDRWMYDPDRRDMLCCILHDAGAGPHMHIQVHPMTRRR